MYLFGENTKNKFDDHRPEVHDSDGLLVLNGNGEWLWRPLDNSKYLRISAFVDENPKGFGLLQRDREPAHYLDFEANYEQRPSAWVEPVGDWGKGWIELVEIPSQQEIHDNVVAYWVPREKAVPQKELHYRYRLYWFTKLPVKKVPGDITATYTGIGGVSGMLEDHKRKFVIDFDILNMQKEVEKGIATLEVSASEGEITGKHLMYNPVTKGLTAYIDFKPNGKTSELRASVVKKGKNISELPLRVTFYARVSTESDEQLNSLDNQISFFENFIKSNKNWTYVNGYIDEGISGSTVKRRKKFLQMIDDAKSGYFDLIVTKEVSRFSRNLSDSIKYTQELLANDVGVYFQSNGINTYDPNSEFILNMMGSVAQEEVKRLSSRVKWGHKEAIKKGRVLGSNSITGYKKDDAKLVIVEEEAKKIRKIFELYATGKYGFYKLATELHRQGINNYKENIYDKDTLKRIIQNPKYKGFYRGHTTETIDYRTKQRVYIPQEEQVIYKDERVPAIVSEELWNRANKILDSRSTLMKASNGNAKRAERKYCYTTKIFCSEHNVSYQRMSSKGKQTKPRWACGNYVKYRLDACESPIIAEMDLNNIFVIVMEQVFNNKNEIIKEMLDYYSNLKIDNNYQFEISKLKKEIKTIETKKEKLLELNIDGSINNLEFKERNDKYNEDISSLNIRIGKIEQERKIMSDSFSNINIIEDAIKKQVDYKNNVNEFVDKFLEEIIVYKEDNDRHKLMLKIYLNLLKKPIPTGKGARHIDDDKYSPIFTKEVETLDLGRSDFQRNSFKINVYLSRDID